jgi:exopolyphosphatase/guanosine-5'-triphosphate,3'-diphosphate pyrophosphatase
VKVASIDVGSYSCRLSVADFSNSFRIIYEEGNITSLATGLKENGYLQEEPMEETLRTIKKYTQVAKQHGAERIVLIGTEALRRAKNAQEFGGCHVLARDPQQYEGRRQSKDLSTHRA